MITADFSAINPMHITRLLIAQLHDAKLPTLFSVKAELTSSSDIHLVTIRDFDSEDAAKEYIRLLDNSLGWFVATYNDVRFTKA